MDNKDDLLTKELHRLEKKEELRIKRYKKLEQKKEAKRLKRLEKEEDRAFAKLQKQQQPNFTSKKIIQLSHKISICILTLLNFIYFLISFFQNKITIFNNILFFLIINGFLLTATIQKKEARKTISLITCILFILWIILHI